MAYECCWFNPERNPLDCPNIEEGEEYLYASPRKRFVEKCIDCDAFERDMCRLPNDDPFSSIIKILREEYRDQKSHLISLSSFLSSKSREIKFLHELSVVLQTSMELDEVLSVAMTAITSGKGFGMNRAFLLMTDREREYLVGHIGVGPKNYEEAWQIWDDVDRSNFSLKELSRDFFKSKISLEKAKFQDVLEKLTVSRKDENHIFNRALKERRPILVENAFTNPEVDPKIAEALGVGRFLIMPLISRNRSIGILLADNFVTNKQISPRDMESLQTFAFPVAFAIERASLYERLQVEVEKKTRMNQQLQEQQDLIVRMEKMAVVGKVTSSIAHSIRNPLVAIGGYARSLLKSDNLEKKKEYLEFILNEARHLDEVLGEVISYSDTVYPIMDWWDVNQLAIALVGDMKDELADMGVTAEFCFSPDMPQAWLDYKQISYCLKTIINHILQSQPTATRIELKTWVDGGRIILCVSDNGISISSEMKTALITPFMETEAMGSGVGLPLCRMILERHGSAFTIEDRSDGGTSYSIILENKRGE
ncbi:MAG: GAF domain-containing protein [Geobacteraceae bacterium]|nr:GAF domain-containing protein [Geobacteraceae bacterium]